LASQLERAAISIAANIAEGFGRESRVAFANFLSISLGSLREAEALTLIAQRLPAPRALVDAVLAKADEVGKALFGLRRSVRGPDYRRPKPLTDD
jgi:four helix bundle protein